MQKIDCNIELLPSYDPSWGLPTYAKPGDAGFDLRAAIPYHTYLDCFPKWISDHTKCAQGMMSVIKYELWSVDEKIQQIIPCGFKIAIPEGYQLEIRPRSGLAAKHGITVVNAPGTVDSGYRGEVKVILVNLGVRDFRIDRGDKIAQAVLMPAPQINFNQVEKIDETERGEGGFGSTGVQ